MAKQITKAMNSSVGRYRFKGVIPGYSKFSQLEGPIEWLVQSGLVVPVYIIESPAIPLRSQRKNNIKLFLFDIGLLGCMADIPIGSVLAQDFGTYKGFFAENYVAQELQSSGVPQLYSWRGRTSEVEFLVAVEKADSGSPLILARSAATI